MRRRLLPYIVGLALAAVVLGISLEFRRLDAKRAEDQAARFSPAEYARDFWDGRLPGVLDAAQPAGDLIRLFNTEMEAAVARGRTLGQSRSHAYLLEGQGQIVAVERDGLHVSVLVDGLNPEVLIRTGSYIPGNAVRDASGLVDVSAFPDTMKFNRISAEINRIVVQQVIRPFLDRAPRAGMRVQFVGAADVAEDATQDAPFGGRKADGSWHLLRVIPIRLELD
jgi:predicted lipoprotein